jgi:hypothetical protein
VDGTVNGPHPLRVRKTIWIKEVVTETFLHFSRFLCAKVLSTVSPDPVKGFFCKNAPIHE